MSSLKFVGVFAGAFLALAAHAAPVLPSVTDAGWTTDRYEPASWANVGTYQGRNNVLGIGINDSTNAANRPGGQQGSFYNTQGRQIGVTGGTGDSIAADLFLDANWASSQGGFVRTDLWGRSAGATETGVSYPIIGFTNFDTPGARLRVFDSQVGWINLAIDLTSLYGTWVALKIEALATGYEFFVNGTSVFTDNTLGSAGGDFTRGFLQAYNFNESSVGVTGNPAYTAHWSDPVSNQVPVPGPLVLTSLALCLLGFSRRRRALPA
jgi:hypothetical protein